MKFQLLHVMSVPYRKLGSLSQMLPEPSTTKTRSIAAFVQSTHWSECQLCNPMYVYYMYTDVGLYVCRPMYMYVCMLVCITCMCALCVHVCIACTYIMCTYVCI